MERYTLDPTLITLDEFYILTRDKKLIPSRIALHDRMEKRFAKLREAGISHLGALIKSLKSSELVANLSAVTGIPESYLILLKREAGSYLASPFPLSDIPGVPHEYTEVLKSMGIRNTRDFFEKVQSTDDRSETSGKSGIPVARLKEIFSLTDLSRITGVGPVFARVVYQAGITSVDDFAQTKAESHYRAYMTVIEKYGYAAGHFSEGDIQYCIDYARVLCRINLYNTKS